MTNIVGFEGRASVERQAREWLIRLDGDDPLSETEIQGFREWMAGSPLHREEIRRLSRFWKKANVLTELAVPLATEGRKNKGSARRARWTLLTVACAALVMVTLTWWYVQHVPGSTNGIYGTPIGQQQTVALNDGSSVQLNTDSQVQVIYSERSRRIRLLRGEALFSVKPDPGRPFLVYAADNVVRAVGTVFIVRLEGSNVDVTVASGAVDVADSNTLTKPGNDMSVNDDPQSRHGRMKAGQMTVIRGDTHQIETRQLTEPELHRRTAWHDGYLVFSGEPLSEVVEQLNRYSPVTVAVGDPKLLSIGIGGRFRIGDLDAILDVLRTNFGIQSRQVDERTIRLESDSAR